MYSTDLEPKKLIQQYSVTKNVSKKINSPRKKLLNVLIQKS